MQKSTEVRLAKTSDWPWVERIFKQHAKMLGNFFWMKQSVDGGKGKLYVVEDKGFVHFKLNREKIWVVQDIAVDLNVHRGGIGSALLGVVPRPTLLKTDSASDQSNAFYKKHGFICVGTVASAKGKPINVYQRW